MKKVYVVVLTVNGTVVWLEVCSSIKSLMEELKGVACDFNGEKLDAYLKTVTEDTFKIAEVRKVISSEYRIIIRNIK